MFIALESLAGDINFGEGVGERHFVQESIHDLTTFATDSTQTLVADNMVHQGLLSVVDHTFGGSVGDCFNKFVPYVVERICIWDISALKWGKVLLQIFPDPRGSRFLARTCSFVRWYGYGCARTW